MCNLLANDINTNIEFAILITMLKRTNECNNIFDKSKINSICLMSRKNILRTSYL